MGYGVMRRRKKDVYVHTCLLSLRDHSITHYLLTAIGLLLDCYWTATGLLLDCYWIAAARERIFVVLGPAQGCKGARTMPASGVSKLDKRLASHFIIVTYACRGAACLLIHLCGRKNAVAKFRDLGLSVGFHSIPERASRGTVDGIKD